MWGIKITKKLIVCIVIMFLLIIGIVKGDSEAHGESVDSSDASVIYAGWYIQATTTNTITQLNRETNNDGNDCAIFNNACTLLTNGTFAGDNCTLDTPITMVNTNFYYVLINGQGAANGRRNYDGLGGTVPIVGTHFDWISGGYVSGGSCGTGATQAHNIESVTVDVAGAGTGGTIIVNITYPSNESGFGIDNFSISHDIWINGSHNNMTNTTCSVNDTRWDNLTTNNGANQAMDFNFTFVNNTQIIDGFYNLYVYCNQSTPISSNGTSLNLNFTVDSTYSVQDPIVTLLNNQTIVYNGTLYTQINFSDNIEIYSINVTFENETVLFNQTNMGVTHYEVNISGFQVNNDVSPTIESRVCDAHTAREIKEIKRIDVSNNGLNYVIEDNPFLAQDRWVHIYPKVSSEYLTPMTYSKTDRYTFTFNKKIEPSKEETFIVESSDVIDIVKLQTLGGHLVVPSIGDNGYWIDFNNPYATNYKINRINDYKVEVIVTGLNGKKIEFNSIGELNCVTKHWQFSNLNPSTTYTQFIVSGEEDTSTLNVTVNSSLISDINATLYYNGTKYEDGTHNFSVTTTAPTVSNINSTNVSLIWDIEVFGLHYNLTEEIQNISNFFIDNCFAGSQNAMNFSLLNITDDGALSGPMEFYLEYVYSGVTKNYSTTTTNTHQDFCVFPAFLNTTGDVEVEYSAGDSDIFNSFFNDINIDNVSNDYSLYVTDGTTQVVFTVYDENNDPVEDVFIHVLEWDVGTGTYKESQIIKTDSDGNSVGYIILNDAWYKFELYYQGINVLTTAKTKVTETTKDFYITLGGSQVDIDRKILQLNIDLIPNRTNKSFELIWDGISGTASEIWLNVTTSNFTDGTRKIYSYSSTVTSGDITYEITEDTTNQSITYEASVWIISTDDFNPHFVTSESIRFDHAWSIYGEEESLFASFIFIGTMIFVGVAVGPEAALVMAILGTIGSFALGFIRLGYNGLGALILVLIIVLIKMRRDK